MVSSRWIVVLAGAFVAGAACGGRTGDELGLDGYGGAIGGDGAASGFGGSGGVGGKSGSGGGSGGRASGGKGGVGGGKVTGGRPGTGGIGPLCTIGSCEFCDNCFDSCLCGWGFDSSFASTCKDACFGSAGGGPGVGGFPGTGAFPGTGGYCGSGQCAGSGIGSSDYTFYSCCGPAGVCGWYSDPSSPIQTLGCFTPEWGPYDNECPVINNHLGCCRSNGTCGVDLNTDGLGCVPATYTQSYGCDGISGSGGFTGTGGFGGAGGFGGVGGKATGGVVGVGGTGPTPEQCVSQARSECEVCACKSCFDSFVSCFQDEGCPYILQCANLTGCTGTDCLNPGTCADVINQHGGIGSSAVQRALPLFSCISSSGCNCGFGR